ncbi:SPOR domain-containing protein [Azospirillum sp. B2RO_4]|uniref:SPOR domain-containing protein n=1 Tax=Azospirillum sp. B2RO_4 TaxID=3027796 RepID=UPI003DAA183E
MTLQPPPRRAPTLTTPTSKDEMKANGKPSETPPPENEDIAKLLRALNEDLRADPQDEDVEYEEEEPAGRSLPLGKIALALLAAGGIAVGVVYFGSGDPAPVTTAANNSAPLVPAPAITRAPANPAPTSTTTAPATESLPAPAQTAPIQSAPVQTAPSAAPPPPVAALPASPPPVLKVPEPPSVPATAPATSPKPRAATPSETAPAAQKPEPPKPEAAKPEQPAAAPNDTGALQAMLAPPKDAAKRPPAASAGNGESKPNPKAAPSAAPSTAPSATQPAGRYTVQVGTFTVTANADSLAQRLQGSGFQAYTVDWTDSSNRSWRAVRVGGFPDPAAAKREAEQLKSKMGLNPVVVTTR